jgi:Plasmid pRiA4b ORF-3-like protein
MTLTFKAKLNHRKKIYREFSLCGDCDLATLSHYILKCFEFDDDHGYGFYSNLKNKYRSEEKYELFADEDNQFDSTSDTRGVTGVLIANVFEPKKKMLYLFDYGDNWEFEIECKKVDHTKSKETFKILKTNGDSPLQYPDYEDEEDEEI